VDLLGLNPYVEVEDSAIPIGELKPRERRQLSHLFYEARDLLKSSYEAPSISARSGFHSSSFF